MELSSTSFLPGKPIPKIHSGDGKDVSPELSWRDVPEGVREFALTCDDPDAPTPEPWVHWVVFNIPADCRQFPEGFGGPAALRLPQGMLQGRNSWPDGPITCYRGPLPPHGHGVHHYHFKLYALDQPVIPGDGCSKTELLKAIQGHVLAEAELIGTYVR